VVFRAGVQYLHHVYAPPGLVDGNTDGRKLQSLVKVDAAPASPVRLQGFFTHGAADTDGYGAGVPAPARTLPRSQMMTVHNNVWNRPRNLDAWLSEPLSRCGTSGFREDEDHEPRPPFTRAGPPYVRDDGTGLSSGAASYSGTPPAVDYGVRIRRTRFHGFRTAPRVQDRCRVRARTDRIDQRV
jgi:hypothetical protein